MSIVVDSLAAYMNFRNDGSVQRECATCVVCVCIACHAADIQLQQSSVADCVETTRAIEQLLQNAS